MSKLSTPQLQNATPTKEQIQFGKFKLQYDNLSSAEQIISGLANFTPRTIMPSNKTPFIIDAGSNLSIWLCNYLTCGVVILIILLVSFTYNFIAVGFSLILL
jgi:hypothetical protein